MSEFVVHSIPGSPFGRTVLAMFEEKRTRYRLAPMQPGEYHEHFSLVEEGTAWFSDPGQGGPADDQIEAWIVVDPGAYVVPGFPNAMPPVFKAQIPPDKLKQLVQYLEENAK